MTQPVPGWYPDPSGKPGQMYWDGQQWVPPGPPQKPDLAPLRRRWTSLRTRTKIAAVAAVIAIPVFTVWVFIGVADSVFRSSDPAAQSSSGHNPFPGGNNTTCNPAWTCDAGSGSSHQPGQSHAPSHVAAPDTSKLSPYQKQKLSNQVGQVCDAVAGVGSDPGGGIGGIAGDIVSGAEAAGNQMALASLMMGIKGATNWTDDQAIAWMKQVVSTECPEYLNKF
jgi:hypothetical protein